MIRIAENLVRDPSSKVDIGRQQKDIWISPFLTFGHLGSYRQYWVTYIH